MANEVGEITHSDEARKIQESRKTKPNWKMRLASTAAGAALLGLAGLGIKETIDANSQTPHFGEPLNDKTLIVDLNSVTTENGSEIKPTFREDPRISAKELDEKELTERGIDVSSGKLEIREVRGGTYPTNPLNPSSNVGGDEGTQGYGFVVDKENDTNYGIWGEVVATDPNTGEEKPTGIYLSKNFYPEPKSPQEAVSE